MQYGYINEHGYLTSKIVKDITEKFINENGELKERTITVEMQIRDLSQNGWKPVIPMDESKRECEEGYYVRVIPYDAGDYIDYNYVKKFDTQRIKQRIEELKNELSGGDYKVIKCYEANLLGTTAPYNIATLHEERQLIRDEINKLEDILASHAI